MPIITINRGSYSRGKAVAEKLALRLGYTCLSRDILLEASEEFNIPEMKLVRALHDAPSVLERFRHGKERYLSYIYSALLQHASKDNLVYHGLAGQFFLRGIPHVFKVRIIANMQERVKEEMRRENISADKALAVLQQDDEERHKWGLQVYGTDTRDSRLYDMILHIDRLSVDDAVDIVAAAVQKPAFQATAQSRKQVEDLALAARVKANLAEIAPKAEVAADQGTVFIGRLNGASANPAVVEKIRKIAEQVEGAVKIVFRSELHEQSDHINPFHNIG